MKKRLRIKNKSKTIYIISDEFNTWGTLPSKVLRSFINTSYYEVELENELFEELIEKIFKYSRGRLWDYLQRQERSEFECINYLKGLHLHQNLIEKIIDLSKSKNYINNRRYADLMIDSLIRKGKSYREIKHKLMEKRIDQALVEALLSEKLDNKTKEDLLGKAVLKTMKRFSDLPKDKQIDKTISSLARRGFYYEDIKQQIDKITLHNRLI